MQPHPDTGAVIFDMDGLLLDTERVCRDAFVETRLEFGLAPAPEIFLDCIGLGRAPSERIVAASLPPSVSQTDFETRWDNRVAIALAAGPVCKPGATALLPALQEKNYLMGVATSTRTGRATDLLSRAGLLDYLDCVIGGDLVTEHKPDPEVYHTAAATLGVDIVDCTGFEDSDPGIRAAVASGARAIQIPDLKPPSAQVLSLGHPVCPDLLSAAEHAGLITAQDIQRDPGHRLSNRTFT